MDCLRRHRPGGGRRHAHLRCDLACRYHGALPQHLEDAIFGTSLKTYGWVYLVVGVLLILSAFAVMSRSQLGIWVGVVFAALASISAIWWMPYYPI